MNQIKRKTAPTGVGGLYKPKIMTQEDLQKGFSQSMQGMKHQPGVGPQPKIDVKPISQQMIPQRQEQYGNPRFGKQQVPNYWQQPQQQQPPQKQEIDEPYWSAEEWESWAFQLYHHYPDTRRFLPEWFIEAIEAEQQQ